MEDIVLQYPSQGVKIPIWTAVKQTIDELTLLTSVEIWQTYSSFD